jgi:YVTN family beta-propeller protein
MPLGAAISPTGLAYVTRFDTDSLGRIDLGTAAVAGSVVVGSDPEDILFDAAGAKAYVTNFGSRSLGVIDPVGQRQSATFPLPAHPFRALLAPGGARIFVTMDNGTVGIVNATTGALNMTQPTGSFPNGLAVTSSGTRLYVGDAADGTVTEINTNGYGIARTLVVGGTTGPVQDLVVAPDDRSLYVANEAGWVAVVDLSTWSRTDSIPMPGAYGMALTPDGTQLWVTQPSLGTTTVLDCVTHQVVGTAHTFGLPRRIAFTRDGSTALIANEAGYAQIIR